MLVWVVWGVCLLALLYIESAGVAFVPLELTYLLIFLVVALPFLPFIPMIIDAFSMLLGSSLTSTFYGNSKEAEEILRNGIPAIATIESIGETDKASVTINDQPYLKLVFQIDDGRREPYQVEMNLLVPRARIPAFQPGNSFQVRVSREDESRIVMCSEPEETRLLEFGKLQRRKGEPATAKLISIRDAGKSSNFKFLTKLTWEIQPHGGKRYQKTFEKELTTAQARQLKSKEGDSFNAHITKDRDYLSVDSG